MTWLICASLAIIARNYTGMGKPIPVQLFKAEAEKEATKDTLLASGVDEEMTKQAFEA